ncbi:MAG: hypothetical protein ACOYBJ_00275 [Patescibacteria group bacterium]|jgi:hypothetical protein
MAKAMKWRSDHSYPDDCHDLVVVLSGVEQVTGVYPGKIDPRAPRSSRPWVRLRL